MRFARPHFHRLQQLQQPSIRRSLLSSQVLFQSKTSYEMQKLRLVVKQIPKLWVGITHTSRPNKLQENILE